MKKTPNGKRPIYKRKNKKEFGKKKKKGDRHG
jgi:hypothetical protein